VAEGALAQALQTLTLMGGAGNAAGLAPAPAPTLDLNNLAALLALENNSRSVQMNPAAPNQPQPYGMYQSATALNDGGAARYSSGSSAARYSNGSGGLPFANLPGFNQPPLTSQAPMGLTMPAALPPYQLAPQQYYGQPQPAFPAAHNATALAAALAADPGCRLSGGAEWALGVGTTSPFGPLDAQQHASAASSPPRSSLAASIPLIMQNRTGSGSSGSGSISPDLDANRLAMWQLQNELLAGGRRSSSGAVDWTAQQVRRSM
jgi:hypothetical protein